jgi:hypothetical protein
MSHQDRMSKTRIIVNYKSLEQDVPRIHQAVAEMACGIAVGLHERTACADETGLVWSTGNRGVRRYCRRWEPSRIALYAIERRGLFSQAKEGREKEQAKNKEEAEQPRRKRRQANKKTVFWWDSQARPTLLRKMIGPDSLPPSHSAGEGSYARVLQLESAFPCVP